MKKIISLIMAVVIITTWAACSKGSGLELKKSIDGYQVTINLSKNPAIVGHNPISIKIEDNVGKAITDANVLVEYSMPEMPGMPAMNYEVPAELAGNSYGAHLNISMSGSWNIAVKIIKGEQVTTVRLSIDAR